MTPPEPWKKVWSTPGERLFVEARAEDGWTRHRTRSNSHGDGAVAVVSDGTRVLFIKTPRPAIDHTLWELPRGQADAGDESAQVTAAREVLEETGRVALKSRLLGKVWPDSGLSADGVNVVIVDVDPTVKPAPAEYSEQRWITVEGIQEAIADGLMRDGISLAALALAWAKGELGGLRNR